MSRNRPIPVVWLAASLLLSGAFRSGAAPQATDQDARGCKDHPLFTRMQGMRLALCKMADFDKFSFKTAKNATVTVEGKRFEIRYQMPAGGVAPSALAIIRNHQQAMGAIGGRVAYEDSRYAILTLTKDGAEVWAQVDTAWGRGYMLTIVEKGSMVQEVAASAEVFGTGLRAAGHVEVPGIYFDTGKSALKPESSAALAEIAKLLNADASLKVFVVGHTDNVASLELNTKLSQSRAEAVVQALVTQHGIAASRLAGRGVGPLAPVGSNDSEEGRAKNRRVELVKQ